MKKNFFLFIFVLLCCFTGLQAQTVFNVNYKSDAKVKVYVANYKSDADLVVYKCKYKSDATGNDGLWFFTDYKSDAKFPIFFCDYKSDADLVIFFSEYKSDAGWKNSSKKHLLYWGGIKIQLSVVERVETTDNIPLGLTQKPNFSP